MQTFLPYPDLELTAQCLDWRRLGKQRVEGYQILKALTTPGYGWQNHPAVKMWRGHEGFLARYTNAMVNEWKRRGYNNTMPEFGAGGYYTPPSWFGDDKFHASHRSNLLRKDPIYYGKFGWTETPDLPYVWPV
jgi:hypothetical protein